MSGIDSNTVGRSEIDMYVDQVTLDIEMLGDVKNPYNIDSHGYNMYNQAVVLYYGGESDE